MNPELLQAWTWREERGLLSTAKVETAPQALRVFHGPGESRGELRNVSIDLFGSSAQGHYWVIEWGSVSIPAMKQVSEFLKSRGAISAVLQARPEKGSPAETSQLLGQSPQGRFSISEEADQYSIQLLGTRHPGLFLDHAPLRQWLRKRAKGWKVLNTFAYTGSLSVACGSGGASHVTTLDLSKSTIAWAEENWRLNGLSQDASRFISGDVFEWLPRLAREKKVYDCVILDPPSFSHGKKGSFSTAKDLQKLHELAMDLLAPNGFLVTSINSANVTRAKYESDILAAARSRKVSFQIMSEIQQPETFPSQLGDSKERYLKGWILRKSSGMGASNSRI